MEKIGNGVILSNDSAWKGKIYIMYAWMYPSPVKIVFDTRNLKKKKDQNYIPNQFWRSVTWIGIMYMPLLVVAGKNTMLKALILEELLKTIIIDEASSYKRRRDSEFVKWGSLIADKNNLNLALRRKMFLNTDYLK